MIPGDNQISRSPSTSFQQAVLYVRVSSKEQETGGFSIDAQERLLREYALERRFHVTEVFKDVETAKRAGRTSFGKMVCFLREHAECSVLLVEKTDRLYRNFSDYVTLDDFPDLEIHFVKENSVIRKNSRSSEKFVHGIKVLMAKNYVDNLREETQKGMMEKARQGIWPSFAPIGYVNVLRPDGKKIIEVDPLRGPLVAMLFKKYSGGDLSLSEVAKLARESGLSPRGRSTLYGKAAIQQILRNPIYRGNVVWSGKTFQGIHEPLVSRELWNAVQDTLEGRRLQSGRRRKHNYPFARLIVCGHCGGLMTGQMHRRHVYYHCSGHFGKCPEPYLRQDRLQSAFSDVLRSLDIDSEVMDWLRQGIALRSHQRDEYRRSELARLRSEHERVKRLLLTMYEDKLAGKIPEWIFTEKLAEYQASLEDIASRIGKMEADAPPDLAKAVSIFEHSQEVARQFSSHSDPEKSKLLHGVVLNAIWKQESLSVRFKQPFDMIADASSAWEKKKVVGLSPNDLFSIWCP